MRLKKYKTKKLNYKVSDIPKKHPKKDLRKYSSLFFWLGLTGILGLVYYGFTYTTWEEVANNTAGTSTTVIAASATSTSTSDEDDNILSIDPEQIENIVNTEALTHAVWPGFRGNINDGNAVRNHFAKNLGDYIIRTGQVPIEGEYKVHFYYVVTDEGNIQFLSLVTGGRTSDRVPRELIREAQRLVNIGVPGIIPGTDANGDPITVIYEMLITFKTSL